MARFEIFVALTQGAFSLAVDVRVECRALALVGPSGSGKTSLLEVLAGLRTPDSGRVVMDGDTLYDSAQGLNVPARARRVGLVPQDVLLFPHLGVRANVTYGQASPAPDELMRVARLLEIEPLLDRSVEGLSGGERQRVALARALLTGPRRLLLDEPLAAVDLARRRRIVDALVQLRDDGNVPMVYVTHTVEEARALADHVLVIDQGRVVAEGDPAHLLW